MEAGHVANRRLEERDEHRLLLATRKAIRNEQLRLAQICRQSWSSRLDREHTIEELKILRRRAQEIRARFRVEMQRARVLFTLALEGI